MLLAAAVVDLLLLMSTYLSLSTYVYLPTYQHIPTFLSISTYLPINIYLPTYQHLPTYLSTSIYLPINIYLPTYLLTSINLLTYLPTYLSTSTLSINIYLPMSIYLHPPTYLSLYNRRRPRTRNRSCPWTCRSPLSVDRSETGWRHHRYKESLSEQQQIWMVINYHFVEKNNCWYGSS